MATITNDKTYGVKIEDFIVTLAAAASISITVGADTFTWTVPTGYAATGKLNLEVTATEI